MNYIVVRIQTSAFDVRKEGRISSSLDGGRSKFREASGYLASGFFSKKNPYLNKMERTQPTRLLALDVFRGMTIFFMIIVNTPGSWSHVYAPLLHAKWDGCTPTDLVFPFFLFIVGVSMAYSFRKYEAVDRATWIKKVLKRTFLIFMIGIALNWFPFYKTNIADLRIFGVLQRIALGFGGAALVVIFFGKKLVPFITLGILFLYWGILLYFGGEDPLSLKDNAVRLLDVKLLGEKHLYGGYGMPFDPEGLLSSLPSIGTALLGYMTGQIILSQTELKSAISKMVLGGLIFIGSGTLWHYVGFPINKPIWSSSYVLFTGGLAMCVLALFLTITDLWSTHKWALPFKVFGMNPLISYVMSGLIVRIISMVKIGETNLSSWMYSTIFQPTFGDKFGSLMYAFAMVGAVYIFAYILYRNGKVVKV